jgi:hypothetical protein
VKLNLSVSRQSTTTQAIAFAHASIAAHAPVKHIAQPAFMSVFVSLARGLG